MVTTNIEKIKEAMGDIYSIFILVLSLPLLLLFWIISLTKGGMNNEEDWR